MPRPQERKANIDKTREEVESLFPGPLTFAEGKLFELDSANPFQGYANSYISQITGVEAGTGPVNGTVYVSALFDFEEAPENAPVEFEVLINDWDGKTSYEQRFSVILN